MVDTAPRAGDHHRFPRRAGDEAPAAGNDGDGFRGGWVDGSEWIALPRFGLRSAVRPPVVRMRGGRQEGRRLRMTAAPHLRLGCDIGGTFTDLVLLDERTGAVRTGKLLTTAEDPSVAMLAGLAGFEAGLPAICWLAPLMAMAI